MAGEVEDGARDVVAGGELVDEALAVRVVERGALAADGLRDEESLAACDADDRGGVELGELEVSELGAGGAGEQEAGAERSRRVGGPSPERGCAAGGQDRGARFELLAVGGHDATAGQDAGRAVAFENLDVGVLDGRGGERTQDPPSRRTSAGVDDPAAAVAALEPERKVAAAVGVELDAELLQLSDPGRRLVRQHLGGGFARQAAPGDQCVFEVELRRVVERERRGGAALRPVGGRLGERPRRHECHFGTLPGGREGGEQPGRAGAHHDEVGSHAGTP